MSGNGALRGPAIIGEHFHNLCIGQSVPSMDCLAIHLGAKHLVAHICVHMVCKVDHCSTLQAEMGSRQGWNAYFSVCLYQRSSWDAMEGYVAQSVCM